MNEKDFKKNFIIIAVSVVVLIGGIVFSHIQNKRVESVLGAQSTEIGTLENRKSVLEAGNKSNTGVKAGVVGLDETRIENDTKSINMMLTELSSIGNDTKKLDGFKNKYGVKDSSDFQINILPNGKKPYVDGMKLDADVYCSGISGATYNYVVMVKSGGKLVMTISLDAIVSSDNASPISNITLMDLKSITKLN